MRLAAWVWPAGLLPVGGLVVALAWVTSNLVGRESAVVGSPAVQITAPASGFKLRQGRTMAIRISVHAGQRPLQSWTLQLIGPQSDATELAEGTESIDDRPVAQVAAQDLTPGETYALTLQAVDSSGAAASDRVSFLVPDPQYTLIPLQPGNMSRPVSSGLSMDASGNRVVMGTTRFGDLAILDAATNAVQSVHLELQGSGNFRLSGSGQRIVFGGAFPRLGFTRALGILDLTSGAITQGPLTASTNLLSTDDTGARVAFQSTFDLDPALGNADHSPQYFLYDDETKQVRQLTSDPNAINYLGPCSTDPLISADGRTVAFLSSATLGIAPADPGVGCRVFAYDVDGATLRQVVALPSGGTVYSLPQVSYEGRWLSFSLTRTMPPFPVALPALLDLRSGELIDPLAGITDSPTFDAAISADGAAVVLTTMADADPRVGNADRNMDLFLLDLASGRLTQISDTTGGIVPYSGTCPPYRPLVSRDGRVAALSFFVVSVERCYIPEPQRNAADGFVFTRVRAVRKRPGNHAPALQPITEAHVTAGETLSLDLTATDPEGDPVVFFAQVIDGSDVPPGSSIEDHRNGSATFTWPTRPDQVGTYHVRVAAFDEGGGETMQDFTITVCDRVVNDAGLPGVIAAIFESEPEPPAACHDADLNHDGAISAADAVRAAGGAL
jgi:hypothetical protein